MSKSTLRKNGPWQYKAPSIYHEPEVNEALAKLAQDDDLELAA
jgi:hypothetical protein